jgi:hypothetical protein
MFYSSWFVAILLLLFASIANSEENFPDFARVELMKHFPKATVLGWKDGLINADKTKDIVAIINSVEITTEYSPDETLVVLYGDPTDSFNLVAKAI